MAGKFDTPVIGSLFDSYFKSIGQLERYKQEYAKSNWSSIVGEKIARHTQPVSVDRGTLFVEVDNSAWLNELQFMKRDMITQLCHFLGGMYIKDINFVIWKR